MTLQYGRTALMIAYCRGHIECVKMLGAQGKIQCMVSLSGVIIHCVHAMQHACLVPSCE